MLDTDTVNSYSTVEELEVSVPLQKPLVGLFVCFCFVLLLLGTVL